MQENIGIKERTRERRNKKASLSGDCRASARRLARLGLRLGYLGGRG
jgi:hypothetical protein